MPRSILVAIAILALGLLAVVATGARTITTAQETTPAGHDRGGHAAATPATDSPYADDYDGTSAIRALTSEQIAQIERGEGAGFALPAELNGVPGPRHVLDLADDLGLSPEQRTAVQAIIDEMRAAVLPAGQRYLAAEQALEADFRSGRLTEQNLPGRVAEVKRREGELAAAHLIAHLRTAEVLSSEQIAAYGRLRGYE